MMARFRSLRWRLTFLYLGLLAMLLLLGGVAQYFAAREVLFRTNADALTSEYNSDLLAFRKQIATRPATAIRALLLSQQFARQLASGHTSAAIFGPDGGLVISSSANITPDVVPPTLPTQDYLNALRSQPKPYYLATASDGSVHLAVLNVLRNGTRALGVVQLSIPTASIDQALSDEDLPKQAAVHPLHRKRGLELRRSDQLFLDQDLADRLARSHTRAHGVSQVSKRSERIVAVNRRTP